MEKHDFAEWITNNTIGAILLTMSLDVTLQFFEVCLVISLVVYNVVRTKQIMNEEKRKSEKGSKGDNS